MNGRAEARVLVVDDEPSIQKTLQTILRRNGYQVQTAATGQEALVLYRAWRPDVILLDLGLPDMDGLELLRELRGLGQTPAVVLSVRGKERDKVAALDLGADDYLTKPFGIEELLARIRVALRHGASVSGERLTVFRTGDLEIDLDKRLVLVAGKQVHLTPTEFDLLKCFAAHPDKLLTDHMLLKEVWGPEYTGEPHYVHVYIGRLRKKLERDPQAPRYLITEPGAGYRLLSGND